MKKRVLLIDDEVSIRTSIKMVLEPTYEVVSAGDGEEGIRMFRSHEPDLVLLDIMLPGMDGLGVLKTIRDHDARLPVVMLTATKTVKTAVDAMKMGAADYITKPFDVDELRLIVARTLETGELEREVRVLRAQVAHRYGFDNLIGKSPAMREIYAKIAQVADTRTTVLITGESGTGKELVARALHFNSARKDKPFIAINCAALPETLIESELFGHEKGAFTDAQSRRMGQFELAHEGSLFLDEIGDLSLPTQAKLLRVLQEREFTRIGGTQALKVDVRIMAATNKNLEELLRRKAFREDLYYRINVVSLYLPPLRERREDIPALAKHFLAQRLQEEKRPLQEFAKETLEVLAKYHWPGNVRELENVVEQAIVWSGGQTIAPEHLPSTLRTDIHSDILRSETLSGRLSLEKAVMEFEREIILDALRKTDYVQTHASALLGISRRMLKYRMDMLGIRRDDGSPADASVSGERQDLVH
ncbi:sigma-54-dependent transcriptional regulator [Candidatus Nitrospira bockiana]